MTIALAQSPVTNGHSAAQSVTVTLGSPTTAGNCLVVCVGSWNALTAEAVSGITLGGSAGNFAKADSAVNGTSSNAEIWTDQNCAGGQTSVVVSTTGGTAANTSIIATVYEVSGVAATGAVDKVAHATGTATSWSSGATATTTLPGEIWFGVFAGEDGFSSRTITAPAAPWTSTSASTVSVAGVETGYFMAGEQIVSSTGTAAYAGSHNDPGSGMHWAAVAVTLTGLSSLSGTTALPVASTLTAGPTTSSRAALTATAALAAGGVTVGAAPLTASTILAATGTVSAGATLGITSAVSAAGITFSGSVAEMDAAVTLTAGASASSTTALAVGTALTATATTKPPAALAAGFGLTAGGHASGSAALAVQASMTASGLSTVIASLAVTGALSTRAAVLALMQLAAAVQISGNEGQPGVGTLAVSASLGAAGQPTTPAVLGMLTSVASGGAIVTHYRRHWGRAAEYVSKSGAVMQ